MRRPVSHSVTDEFDRRNLFLCAALGVIAELRGVRRAARGRSDDRPALVLRSRRDGVRGDEALHALLGLLSVSHTVAAHAAAVPPAPRERRSPAPNPSRDRALRTLLA